MRNRVLRKIRSEDGNMMITLYGRIIVTVLIILFVFELFALVLHKQHIDYISKAIAEEVEQSGQLSSSTYTYLNELNSGFKTNAAITVEASSWLRGNKIQYGDKFSVTVTDNHSITILSPVLGNRDIAINIPVRSKVNARSEVYWRAGEL